MSNPPTVPLAYARPGSMMRSSGALQRLAWICGILPMVVALGLLSAYLITESSIFQLLGFFWLFAGGLIVLTGLVLVAIILVQSLVSVDERGKRVASALLACVVLLANLPMAIICARVGGTEHIPVVVNNLSTIPITSAIVSHGPRSVRLKSISAGSNKSGKLPIDFGTVTISITRGDGTPIVSQLMPAVDEDGLRGHSLRINVASDGTATLGP